MPHLDRLFASAAPAAEADRQFFGDFALAPDIHMKELALSYGLPVPVTDFEMTLAHWVIRRLGHPPGTGDRVTLGEVELIVRALEWDDSIAEIGLAVEPTAIDKPKLPLFQSRAELRGMVRHWFNKGVRR